jgi:hypothetical protein
MGPYAGADYNLTLCRFQSRLQHMYQGQPFASVDLKPYARGKLYHPVRDLGFDLCYLGESFHPPGIFPLTSSFPCREAKCIRESLLCIVNYFL